MEKMNSIHLVILLFLSLTFHQTLAKERSTPFSIALENLQNQINYKFKNVAFLRRAMTHASFSEENNKALSILGESVIGTSVGLRLIVSDVDVSSKDLNVHMAEVAKVDASCSTDGNRLGLQKIVRTSRKTNVTSPSVVCGAFRAIFGAIAVDAESADEAGKAYVVVHGGRAVGAADI